MVRRLLKQLCCTLLRGWDHHNWNYIEGDTFECTVCGTRREFPVTD